jgi:hypothetical protein
MLWAHTIVHPTGRARPAHPFAKRIEAGGVHAYQDVLSNSNPLLIRNVIQWKQLVKSTELYGPDGEPCR